MSHINQWQIQSNQTGWHSRISANEASQLPNKYLQKSAVIFQRLFGDGNQASGNTTRITHKLICAVHNLSTNLTQQLKGQFSQFNQTLIKQLSPNWQQPALAGGVGFSASMYSENRCGMLSTSVRHTGHISPTPPSTGQADSLSSDSQSMDVEFKQLLEQETPDVEEVIDEPQNSTSEENSESNIQGLQELVGDMDLEGDADFSDLSTWVMNVNNGMMPKTDKD